MPLNYAHIPEAEGPSIPDGPLLSFTLRELSFMYKEHVIWTPPREVLEPPGPPQETTIQAFKFLLRDTSYRSTRRILLACVLLVVFVIAPTGFWFRRIETPFQPIPTTCGSSSGYHYFSDGHEMSNDIYGILSTPKNSTTSSGFQSMFTIDRTFGVHPFWKAKLIDTMWDLFVARGMQFIAGWVSYRALSSTMLHALETSPVPYDTFIGIGLNGPSIVGAYSVLKGLGRFRKRRFALLFADASLSMTYVIALPTLLTASSGYISTSAAYAEAPNTGGQLIRIWDFTESLVVFQDPSYCLPWNEEFEDLVTKASMQMSCCIPKTTCSSDCAASEDWSPDTGNKCSRECLDFVPTSWTGSECDFYSNGTFKWRKDSESAETASCNQTLEHAIGNMTFNAWGPLGDARKKLESGTYNYKRNKACYSGRAYDWDQIAQTVQCLPDSSDPKYRWGFSTVLFSIILILHTVWATSNFLLWVDAELHGSLQHETGFQLSQVHSAFMLTAAAMKSTDRSVNDLISLPPEEAAKKLGHREATIEFETFEKVLEKDLPLEHVRLHRET